MQVHFRGGRISPAAENFSAHRPLSPRALAPLAIRPESPGDALGTSERGCENRPALGLKPARCVYHQPGRRLLSPLCARPPPVRTQDRDCHQPRRYSMAPPAPRLDSARAASDADAASGGDMRRESQVDLARAPPPGDAGPPVASPIAESLEKGPAAEPATVSVLAGSNGDTPESSDDEDQPPPPGGTRAWLMMLGTWCCSFCSYGWINSEFSPRTAVLGLVRASRAVRPLAASKKEGAQRADLRQALASSSSTTRRGRCGPTRRARSRGSRRCRSSSWPSSGR